MTIARQLRVEPAAARADATAKGSQAAVDDRRRFERVRYDAEITLVMLSPDYAPIAQHAGRCRDLSRGGVGVTCPTRPTVGAPVVLRFPGRLDPATRTKFGRIANCMPHFSGQWLVGIAFARMPETLQKAAWLQATV